MKIKSWTGNEVEARVAMDCKLDGADGIWRITEIVSTSKVKLHQGYIISGRKIHNTMTAMLGELTMLHCPFQVGDQLEQKVGDLWQKQAKITEIDKTGGIWCGNNPQMLVSGIRHPINKHIRHANPDLRDAPEYKP